MKATYLIYEKAKKIGHCRFCGKNTSFTVRPPEIKKEIQSHIHVCKTCRDTKWKMEELGKIFNRVVERIIQTSEIADVPAESQLRPRNAVSIIDREPSRIFNNIEDWSAEVMIDGIRILAYIQARQVILLSSHYTHKTGFYQDITSDHPELQVSIAELEGTVLDGKIQEDQGNFIAFDCLKYRGTDIRDLDLDVRQQVLSKVFECIGNENYGQILVYKPRTSAEAKVLFEKAVIDWGIEGLMLKNLKSRYYAPNSWIKWRRKKND